MARNNSDKCSVIQYILNELKKLGIKDYLGVPGDYSFPINDAICNDKELRWIGCCNELNASYAADGYARVKGFSALCTTYGVGELSALCGVAGSFTEHLPVFHIVGMPGTAAMKEKRTIHHTLGTGQFDLYVKMAKPAVCASSVVTPANVECETRRLINAAIAHRRPVYMSIASDDALAAVGRCASPIEDEKSDHASLEGAVGAILDELAKAKTAVILPGYLISRLGLTAEATAFVNATGLPFATMFMDKTCLDETHPQYMGIYCGRLMDPEIADMIEGCDLVVNIGAVWSDFNTGAYTAHIDPSKMVSIMHHHVKVGSAVYSNVEMRDIIPLLTKRARKMQVKAPRLTGLGEPKGSPKDRITPAYLYPRYEKFLRPNDIVMAETGTSSQGMGFARMPKGAVFHNQTLWGAIGWATPAAFGAALAAPERRVLLFTGEGSHQMTVQDICQFARFNLKPIIFTLNNNGYLIERILCKEASTYYNDLAQWEYHRLPEALGCKGWFTAKVTTNAELEAALSKAEGCGTGAYIEVVMDKMAMPPMGQKMHENLASLYGKK